MFFPRFNKWLDNLKEPRKFLVFLAFIAPGFGLLSIEDFLCKLLGILYLLILMSIRISRNLK